MNYSAMLNAYITYIVHVSFRMLF